MELNESQTRSLLINPQLIAARWKLSDRTQVRFEVPVEGYDPAPWNGITDFCLYHPSGRVLSVVEAKRASRNPREGEEQLRQYITEIGACSADRRVGGEAHLDRRLRHSTSTFCGRRETCQPGLECVAALPDISSRAEAGCFKPSALRSAVTVPLWVSAVSLSRVRNTEPPGSGPKRSTRMFELSHAA